jgi:hypothetical protein
MNERRSGIAGPFFDSPFFEDRPQPPLTLFAVCPHRFRGTGENVGSCGHLASFVEPERALPQLPKSAAARL